ncbi:hypothetical protein KSP39_PZI013888 [Platanthera zijinensis]|uniref:DDE Tnp4 domain-containing protein n=1 Tax=Platanthera zijinensis TaxID=2320716 RepID=A0AAP0G4A4_9ASPA
MTSKQTGEKWMAELLTGHPDRFFDNFHMSKQIFLDLLILLEESYGLKGSRRTATKEVLGMTLYILGHHETLRKTSERFQHSTETVSRFFEEGLRALTRLSMDIIAPRYMPFFKDCIGVIDGTHVDACIPIHEQVAYIGRHGSPTQNVMAVCDFNMCFTYVVPGWEGSAHDSRIYHRVV